MVGLYVIVSILVFTVFRPYLSQISTDFKNFGTYFTFWTKAQHFYFINFFDLLLENMPFSKLLKKGFVKDFDFCTKSKLDICSFTVYQSLLGHIFFLLHKFAENRVDCSVFMLNLAWAVDHHFR